MRNRYLGDSLDLAKASLLRLSAAAGIATLVAPLPREQNFDFERYRAILGIDPPHVLAGAELARFSGHGRAELLGQLAAALDAQTLTGLLLDPDTGLQQEAGHGPGFLTIAELADLVGGRPVTWLVYHHQGAGGFAYAGAAGACGASWYYDFGKAAVLVGGDADGSIRLLNLAMQHLNPARCIEVDG